MERGRKRGTLWAAAISICAVLGLQLWRSGPKTGGVGPDGPTRPSDVEEATELASLSENSAKPGPALQDLDEVSERSHAEALSLSGRVTDSQDRPVPDAKVTWTALAPIHYGPTYVWDVLGRLPKDGELATTTSENGSFEFLSAPRDAGQTGSVVWVTAPGFRAQGALTDLRESVAAPSLEFRLEPGLEIGIRVVDGSNRPVSGALVEQFGVRTPPDQVASPAWTAAHRALHRSDVTDSDGRVRPAFSEYPATFTLIARAGTARSQPWFSSIDGLESEVVLRIGPQFEAAGRALWPSEIPPPKDGLVTVSGATNAYFLVLGQASVAENGSWGPLTVPLFGATSYTFRLEGEGLGAQIRSLSPPESGTRVRVDFAPEAGFELPVIVVDESSAPVGGAELYLSAGSQDGAIDVQAHTDTAGTATLRGIPAGSASLDVSADGFPPARLGNLTIGPTPASPLRVTLAAAAELRGRVTHAGEAVDDFEIAWWTDALFRGQPPTVTRFSEAVDGGFTLEGLPRGRVSLLACSEEHPRSEALTVDLSAGTSDVVALELPAPIAARGRTVDAFTGEPVAGAVVQQFTNSGAAFVHAWGAPAMSGPDGAFDLSGLAPGDNRLTIQAAGYASRLVSIHADGRPAMELGPLPLFRGMTVVLEYAGNDPRGTTGLHASLIAAQHHPPQPFSTDGTSRFQGVAPGRVVIDLVRDDGSAESHILDLPPASQHTVTVGSAGTVRLTIAVPPDALADLVDPWVSLRDRGAAGLRTRGTFLEAGATSFACEPWSRVAVTLWSAGAPLVTRDHVVGAEDESLLLELAGREASLEIVDASGQAVPHAQIHLYTPDPDGWTHVIEADASGLATVTGLPGHALAGAISVAEGMRFDVPIEPGPASRPTRIELVADAELNLRLVQGDSPARGVQVRVMAANDTYLVGYATTDDDGRVTFAALGEGNYTVHVEHPGIFRRSTVVATGPRAAAPSLSVHPLGAIRFHLRSPDGAPLSDATIEASHAEVPGTLASWVAEKRVPCEGDLRTDVEGNLLLHGVPAGKLEWRATDGSGIELSGAVDVVPGETVDAGR